MKKPYLLPVIILLFTVTDAAAQQKPDIITIVHPQKTETVVAIMQRAAKFRSRKREEPELQYPDRSHLPQNPESKPLSQYPEPVKSASRIGETDGSNFIQGQPQTVGLTFNSANLAATGSFPPDDMGSIGPTQFITAVNGRIRSFNKTTGVADGVLNVQPDAFFTSVMTPPVGSNFTSDPRIRYDRLSGKWIIIIIDVPGGSGSLANRCLLAVSNTSTITGATVWTFSQFTGQAGAFLDYPTLGIDNNALYIGGNMFSLAGAFNGTNGYVINRAALEAGGAYTVNTFLNLCTSSTAGPYTPQGVENYDYTATEGYFIGTNVLTFGTLMMRRVSTPGGTPTISGNISISLPLTTDAPVTVPHLGNTGGTNGNLDAIDDRLFAAMARGGHIWTSHNIEVAADGTTTSPTRNGVRWYDVKNITTTPVINQSGTIFDNAAANPRWYGIPSVMISGQGHAAFSLTTGGLADRSNAATTGRLASDALGTTQAKVLTTASATAYNPAADPGPGRRWGDYSYVSLDPIDDMTLWMINQYCDATDSYGCSVSKLIAPPPATPASCSPSSTSTGQTSVNIVVTGTVITGSGFYDPGANLASPALAFNHISATVTGGVGPVVVNSVTYTDPTHITININTTAATTGLKTVTVTNPDGQSLGAAILTITNVVAVNLSSFTAQRSNDISLLKWSTAQESNNLGFEIQRSAAGNFTAGNYSVLGFVNGNGTTSQVSNYETKDLAPLKGKNFYRLKQVNIDNSFRTSEIREVDFDGSNKPLVYPNPFSGMISVENVADNTDFRILNATGQTVLQGKLKNNQIDASRLVKGIYILQFIDGDQKTQVTIEKK